MGIQLFLEIFDVIHDIVQLLLVTRFRTHQVFLSLLLGLSRGDLLFQDSDLLTDIRLANIYRAKLAESCIFRRKSWVLST